MDGGAASWQTRHMRIFGVGMRGARDGAGWIVVWLVALVLAPTARADGKVLPPMLLPQEVAMPDQRALLAWHEGVQTLVIESAFVGHGTDFAWVVPLPAKPEVESATRGTLASAAALMQPVIRPPHAELWWPVATILVVALWTLVFGWRSAGRLLRVVVVAGIGLMVGGIAEAVFGFGWLVVPASVAGTCWLMRGFIREEMSLFSHLVLVLSGLLLAGLMIPSVGKVRSTLGPSEEAAGVTVERQVVGDHDVSLVSGSDADGVVGWLRDNGYAITGEAETVAREHAAAGGWFVASRVRRELADQARSVPAPLLFRFATERPVYPMRLTGAGATAPLELELFVVGPMPARARGLSAKAWAPLRIGDPAEGNHRRGSGQPHDARVITHPMMVRLARDGSVLTHLRGSLAPARMREDMRVEWVADAEPAKGLVAWARAAAAQSALAAAGGVALIFSVVIGFRRDGARATRRQLGGALVAGALTGGVLWLLLPSVATRDDAEGRTMRWYERRQVPQVAIIALGTLDPATTSDAEARAKFAADLKKMLLEPNGWEMEIGDGPGQVELVKTEDGKWRTVLYDSAGQARFNPREDFEMGWDRK